MSGPGSGVSAELDELVLAGRLELAGAGGLHCLDEKEINSAVLLFLHHCWCPLEMMSGTDP